MKRYKTPEENIANNKDWQQSLILKGKGLNDKYK